MNTKKTKQWIIGNIEISKAVEGYIIEVVKTEKLDDSRTKWDKYGCSTKKEMMEKLAILLKEW